MSDVISDAIYLVNVDVFVATARLQSHTLDIAFCVNNDNNGPPSDRHKHFIPSEYSHK